MSIDPEGIQGHWVERKFISRDYKNGDMSNNNSYSNKSDISSDYKNDDMPIDPEGL